MPATAHSAVFPKSLIYPEKNLLKSAAKFFNERILWNKWDIIAPESQNDRSKEAKMYERREFSALKRQLSQHPF